MVKPGDFGRVGTQWGIHGDRIKFARVEQGLTMSQIADKGGPSKSYQSEVESGKKTAVSTPVLTLWLKKLNISAPFVYGLTSCYHTDPGGCLGMAFDVGRWFRERRHLAEWNHLTPGERLRQVLWQIAHQSLFFTEVSLAYTLKLDLESLRGMLNGTIRIPHTQVSAIACLTLIPEDWLLGGDTEEALLQLYHDVIASAHRKGISPGQLRSLIESAQ